MWVKRVKDKCISSLTYSKPGGKRLNGEIEKKGGSSLRREGVRRRRRVKEGWGAGGKHGQGYAGASACGGGIDGHISHSSVSRRDHRTWLRGGSAWSAVADFADICRWGDTSCDKDCPRHQILSGFWATVAEAPSTLSCNGQVFPYADLLLEWNEKEQVSTL